MSSLVKTYVDTVGALKRGETIAVRLPNGTIVQAVPEQITGPDGRDLMQLHIKTDTPDGPVESVVRMPINTYEKLIVRAEKYAPRLNAFQRRLQLREGKK